MNSTPTREEILEEALKQWGVKPRIAMLAEECCECAAAGDGVITNGEATKARLCLECGSPGAPTYRLRDGRLVRVCGRCYISWPPDAMSGAVELSRVQEATVYSEPMLAAPGR